MKRHDLAGPSPVRSPLAMRLLLGAALLLVTPALAAADVLVCDDKSGKRLQPGSETTDLEVTGPCEVQPGATYTYRNVNIFRDRRQDPERAYAGTLKFLDPRKGVNTDFFAQSIVVENRGSLVAGTPTQPIGPEGTVTIHLWGPEDAPGITCKTDDHCGIPDEVWNSNPNPTPASCNAMDFPVEEPPVTPVGGSGPPRVGVVRDRAPSKDCFYRYEKLDGTDADPRAYFGHKVLAVSYGGTLQLFGDKGATYDGRERTGCKETDPSCTGTSWVRLKGSIQPGDPSPKMLRVEGRVDWRDGDHFVVTTTDYLPSHSEELVVVGTPEFGNGVTTIAYRNADGVTPGVKWPHNGEVYDLSDLPGRLGIARKSAETRAAAALLSRSIEIVSEGEHAIKDSFPVAAGYYGGHTIVRQGFDTYQVQGVRFRQLGQGGRIMHYPVHFHMARRTPQSFDPDEPITFVKDSSIDDSMTRWITIHATQGVTLARNVGYMSIGHGFYLEDGTETENVLNANIGVFARPAVQNEAINPRNVPGILTATAPADQKDSSGFDNFPYYSDSNNPAVFWIMNGWNDFHYNMASGAGTCGACYWFVPGAISGPSRAQKWFGYASEQRGQDRAALTPLKEFIGNSCSSAMTAFTVNSTTATCNGVNQRDPKKYKPNTMLTMLPSAGATAAYKDRPGMGPLIDESYWPTVGGGGRLATRCEAADASAKQPFLDVTSDCSTIPRCGEGAEDACDVTVVDKLTTSFNWAEKNLAAVWMRPFWSLVNDSVVTDVQNAGVNFVTSGDFSKASVITGFWSLARKTVFIGSTQKDNPFASNAGPFNPISSSTLKTPGNQPVTGLKCALDPISGANNVSYCLSQDDGVSIQLGSFSAGQRFFSVYDGPAYQDSNAYLDIHPTYLTTTGTLGGQVIGGCKPTESNPNPCPFAGYMNGGSPGLLADKLHDRCYLPNAGIGWKQPNGFYYAPAFHSKNLFFADGARSVDIRHFVTEPLFDGATFDTDVKETKKFYCYRGTDQPKPGLFQGFTDIDRETVLNDDDGTLTGLTSKGSWVETISVNKEPFFDAPVETPECASDLPLNATSDAKCAPNTAKTSPYEYVTTSIYPECALDVPDSDAPLRKCEPYVWGSACTTSDPSQVNSCVGVRMYRQLLLDKDDPRGTRQLKRMMGQNTFQRSALTANHGVYYIDTTVSAAKQQADGAKSINTFVGGQKYDLFFLYAKKTTRQMYEMYVGKGKPKDFGTTNVKFGYMNIDTAKYRFGAAKPPGGQTEGDLPEGWESVYDPDLGYLVLSIEMDALADDFDLTKPEAAPLGQSLCQPKTMCKWDKAAAQCQCAITDPKDPRYKACQEKNKDNEDAICSWSVKDLDCPAKGCPALQIAFEDYAPDDAEDHHRPPTTLFSDSDAKKDWDVALDPVGQTLSGKQCNYTNAPAVCAQ